MVKLFKFDRILLIFVFGLILQNNVPSYGDVIVSLSFSMEDVIFDGKWTFEREWKESGLTEISTERGMLILRTSHWQNYIYVLLDAVFDKTIDVGADRATVCFDSNNDKTKLPQLDDYCFEAILGGKRSFTYQGGSPLALNGNFEKISNPSGFVGIGSVSDQNDRYSKIPHASYEFRIPIDLIDRKDIYGFYFSVYDAHYNEAYHISSDQEKNPLKIPNPSTWTNIYSPDKSLPEFEWPLMTLAFSSLLFIYITRRFMSKQNSAC
jgi:hypothetical protein